MNRDELIKGIQECNLNGGLNGNCPYKGILVILKEQEKEIEHLKEIIKTADSTLDIIKDRLTDLLKRDSWAH